MATIRLAADSVSTDTAKDFTGKIPAAPPVADSVSTDSVKDFTGKIPAAPPAADSVSTDSVKDFTGKIPSAPPIPEESEEPVLELDDESNEDSDSSDIRAEDSHSASVKKVEPAVIDTIGSNRRVEPPVAGVLLNKKRVEPSVVNNSPSLKRIEPVVSRVLSLGKRVEPPVSGTGLNGKRIEPAVIGNIGKRVEPAVIQRRIEPPVIMAPSLLGMVFTPRNNYLVQNINAILPELRGDETQEELDLREELKGLHFKAQRTLKKGKHVANASFLVVLLALFTAFWGYYEMVLSYAGIRSDFVVTRDSLDHNRVLISYVPQTEGKFAIAYSDAKKKTTILETIISDQVGKEQTFGWFIRKLKDEDRLLLTYRKEFNLVYSERKAGETEFSAPSFSEELTNLIFAGEILDATTNQPIAGAEIRIPGSQFKTSAGDDGAFTLKGFPDGPQTFEVTADGFISYRFEAESSQDPVRILLSPGLADGQIRIVLSWKRLPEDLDAHLEGPLPENQTFHISYGNKGSVDKEFVNLDLDASEGFGPETITVLGAVPGTYRYYVHDYSHQSEQGTDHLAKSDAMVQIYFGNQILGTFRPDSEQSGNLWNVCEICITEDRKARLTGVNTFEDKGVQAMGLYEKRTQENRLEWIESYGGSVQTEEAAALALDWLARHQCVEIKTKKGYPTEGSWGQYCLDPKHECCRCQLPEKCRIKKDHICWDGGPDYSVATTGLAVLAFQAGGNYFFNERKYSENVQKGLDWLVTIQDERGAFVTPRTETSVDYHPQFMYEHGMATYALAEACSLAKVMEEPIPEKYAEALKKGIRFALNIQHDDGGWGTKTDPREVSNTSVSGWMVLALGTAIQAGFNVPDTSIHRLRAFYGTRTRGSETLYQHNISGSYEALTGIGILVRVFLLEERGSAYEKQAAARLMEAVIREWGNSSGMDEADSLKLEATEWNDPKLAERIPDFYTWYNGSLALQQLGGPEWEKWNEIVRGELLRLQCREGCLRGSWDPKKDFRVKKENWRPHELWFDEDGGDGRIYVTALGALTLQVYYRFTTKAERLPEADRATGSASRNSGSIEIQKELSKLEHESEQPGSVTPVTSASDLDSSKALSSDKTEKP